MIKAMKQRRLKDIILLLMFLISLSGCGVSAGPAGEKTSGGSLPAEQKQSKPEERKKQDKSEKEEKQGKPAEQIYDNRLIEEIVYEGDFSAEGQEEPLHYIYRLPKLKAGTKDAKEWNAAMEKLASDAMLCDLTYDSIEWESHWDGSLLSMAIRKNFTYEDDFEYQTGNYDFALGKFLSNEELCSRMKISGEEAEDALRLAAAGKFDEDCRNFPEAYDGCFGALAELRAQTVSASNLRAETASLFLDGDGRLCAYALIGAPAGSGTYAAGLRLGLTAKKGVGKRAKCDFITAELKDNAATVTFTDTGLAGLYLHGDKVKFDTPYPVEGLYGEYTDLALGFVGNGGYVYLFLTDTAGCVTFCNIMNGIECGPRFFAIGPLQAPVGVKSYKTIQDEGGSDILAVTDEEEADLSEVVFEAEATLPMLLLDSVWYTADKGHTLGISGDPPFLEWGDGDGVLADGLSLSYLGMDGNGLHFYFIVETAENVIGEIAGGCLTMECHTTMEGPEGENILTLTQTYGKPLSGVPEDFGVKLFHENSF